MRHVRELLKHKGANVVCVSPDQTVFEALQLMATHNIGAVAVLEDSRLVGIFSEREYARSVILLGRTSRDTLVREIMVSRVLYVTPSHRVSECMALMTDKRTRHLPVVENDVLIGLISLGDVVKDIISEQSHIIEDLEAYISPGR